MNSNTSQMKRGRRNISSVCHKKLRFLRNRKISSTSNKSQLSQSHITVVTGGYKKRISALLKNNKTLANALQDSRQELSDMKNHLQEKNEQLNEMMFVRSKMLHMHSTLQSFTKDFDETLQLLKQDDTRWPTLGYIMKCRKDFKNKMQNVIEPVEETSERASIFVDPDVEKCFVENEKSLDMIVSTPVASKSKEVPSVLQTELDKEAKKESGNLININEDVVDCDQANNTPVICEKLAELNSPAFGDLVLKIPASPGLACRESNKTDVPNDKKNCDGILHGRDLEISATPELSISCPSVKPVINLHSSHSSEFCHLSDTSLTSSAENISGVPSVSNRTALSAYSKTSKIPRFQDLSADVKKRTRLFNIPSKANPNCAKKQTKKTENKSYLDVYQTPFTEKIEMSSENTAHNFNNECSDNEGILTAVDPEVTDVKDCHRRKTFVVQKSENVNLTESQSDRRKTFVKKTCKTDRKPPISNKDKRKTFIVIRKDDVDESANNSKNCSTFISASTSDNITQNRNVANLLGDSKEISTVLPASPVLNNTIISISTTEEFNNKMQSVEMLTDENNIPDTNHFQESQLRDEQMVNIPVRNCVEGPSVFCNTGNDKKIDNSLQSTERLVNVCMISPQNSVQESQVNDQNGISVPKISEAALVRPIEIKCNDFPANLNVTLIQDQNMFLESEINGKKENEEKVIEFPESNLQECSVNDNDNLRAEKEFNQGSDKLLLKTLKLKKKSLVIRHKQKISNNFDSSSDSETEIIPNTDFDFDMPLVKDPPIRRCIPKNKPSKVFVFDANKRKSSFFKNRQNKLKPTENPVNIHDEDNILTQSNNDIVSNIKTQNIQEDAANVNVPILKKKKLSVRFAQDICIDGNNISNTDSKSCKSMFDNSSKQQELPKFATNGKQKAEDIRESSESLTASEIKAKVSSLCPEADASSSCQANIFSNYANRSEHDQNECNINCNSAKNETSDAIVKIQHSDMENKKESKQKKLKRKKQKPLSDSYSLDDCLSIKRSKLTNCKKVHDVSSQAIILAESEKNGNFGSKHAKKEARSKEKNVKKKVNKFSEEDVAYENTNKETKSKQKNMKKKVNKFSEEDIACENTNKETKSKEKSVKKKVNKRYIKENKFGEEDMACKNTIVVHAEIHPPPPSASMLPFDSSSKENMELDETTTKRLSVVLSDVLQSKDIINLNISCGKEYLLCKENTHLPSKTPLTENSCNMQISEVTKSLTRTAHDSHCIDEIKTYGRRRAPKISYKEPSLTLKMRR